MTASTLVDRQTPNNLWVVNYNGVMSNKVFANFQWSKKDFGFRNAGGTSTAIVRLAVHHPRCPGRRLNEQPAFQRAVFRRQRS